jgi:3-oxoacyl-[acyl-carrier protein] reductase
MTDSYLEMTQTPWGKALTAALGMPQPPRLARDETAYAQRPLDGQDVLIGGGSSAPLARELIKALAEAGAVVRIRPELPGLADIKAAGAALGVNLSGNPVTGESREAPRFVVFDACALSGPAELRALYDFFQPLAARFPANTRIVVLGRPSEQAASPAASAAAGALIGFVKSIAKEIGRKGSTANVVEVAKGSEGALGGTLRYFLSDHSSFVSGQSLAMTQPAAGNGAWEGPLSGKVALVTGAARGIGASIAQVLAREGAQVIGMDRPQEEGALGDTLSRINGVGLPLDVTAGNAPASLVSEVMKRFGGLDIVVHNAGITRDKTLRNMRPDQWDMVLDVNLGAIVRVNDALLKEGLKPAARMVCISSIGGIAGNPGQTNYGATKAGVIAYVRALAPEMAKRGGAVNAVAPGFIETAMTAAMPVGPRVVGRLMSSLSQGGLPLDIAEAVNFFSGPYAAGVNGQTLRVCGQHLVGK